jgi:hypothetical protein
MAGIAPVGSGGGNIQQTNTPQQLSLNFGTPENKQAQDQNALVDRAEISEQGTRTERAQDGATQTGLLPTLSKDKKTEGPGVSDKKPGAPGGDGQVQGDGTNLQGTDENQTAMQMAMGARVPTFLTQGTGTPGGPNSQAAMSTMAAGGPVAPGGQTPGGLPDPNGLNTGPVAPNNPNYPMGQDPAAKTNAMNMAMMSQNDSLQAGQVYWQMVAERQKSMWKIFQMLQDLQTSIMSIIADVAAKRAKTMDAIAQKWAAVLGA